MLEEKRKINARMFISIGLLILGILAVLLLSRRENYVRQMRHVEQFMVELSDRTTQHVSDIFQDKLDAMVETAYLYGQTLDEDVDSQVDLEQLKALETNSGFDWIRFVDTNGIDYASDGRAVDVSDRDYFTEGIKGKNGISWVPASRVSGEKLMGFYAPIVSDGKVQGVLVGFLQEKTITKILKTNLYGYTANTMILDKKANVLGRNLDENTEDVDNVTSLLEYVQKEKRAQVKKSFQQGENIRFSYQGMAGASVACLNPIEGTDWMLLQLFPSEALREVSDEVTRDEQFVLLLLALICVIFGIQVTLSLRKRKEIENQDREKNHFTSLLQSMSDDYICLIDVDLKTEKEQQFRMFEGEQLEDWAGGNYDYNHCIKSYAYQVVGDKDRERFLEATEISRLKNVLKNKKDFFIEYEGNIAGKKRQLQGKFTLSSPEKDEQTHMLIGIRDITEQVKTEVRQKTSMDLIVSAASTVYPYILELNLSKNRAKTIYNAGIVHSGRMENCSVDEIIEELKESVQVGGDYERLYDTMSRSAQLRAYNEGKRELTIRVRQTGDDGKIHWMEVRNILMKNSRGDVFAISMTRCVDNEIKQTLDLERAKNQAESSNRAKSTFLFNMSHDIRTPMNAIMGFSAMAEKYVDDPEKVLDCLKKLNVSGEHLLHLINDVLDMSRIESGKLELEPKAYHVPTTVKNVGYIFNADLQKKDLQFDLTCDIQDEILFFDMVRMNQVELNLISNAIKYTPAGGRIEYVIKQIGREKDYALIRSTVKDTGIGMSKEFCKHVFEAFEREKSRSVSGIEGSGLGLAITKRLIEQMGGRIFCRSEQGKGSEFIFEVAFKIGSEEDLEAEEVITTTPGQLKGKRVLLVEDNALNREITREILNEEGIIIEEADDGDVAVNKVKWSEPGYYDMVLMDIQMPKMDGYEATRQIRALDGEYYSNLPIVAVTANAFEEDKNAAKEAGMNDHIAKPIRLEEVREQLVKWMSD